MRKIIVNSTPLIEKQGIYFSDTLKSRVKRIAGEI